MKTFKLQCEILSPIHIGAGYEIDPLSYLIQNGKLYKISFENLVASMDEAGRATFEGLIDKGNLIEIRKFVVGNINKDRDTIFTVEVSAKVESLYKSKIGDIQNQLLINPFIRTEGASVPFMPGSSIKGAIRTAVISEAAKNGNLPAPKEPREIYEFESKVLGYKDGKDDPFRGIKIRDKAPQKDGTVIRDVRNVSKKKGASLCANDIQIICEVTHSNITGKTVAFETEISFDEQLYATHFLSKSLDMEKIIRSCTDFYKDKMVQEHMKFYKNSDVEASSMQLLDTVLDKTSFLLRLGRFSGVESVTLDRYRNPRPPGNKSVWGTSRNLTEGVYPMGWMRVIVR